VLSENSLEAEAQTRCAAVAHEVVVALDGGELDERLQAVREGRRCANRDVRPVARRPLALEGEPRAARRFDEAGIDVAWGC
jgi:hypothetical protein